MSKCECGSQIKVKARTCTKCKKLARALRKNNYVRLGKLQGDNVERFGDIFVVSPKRSTKTTGLIRL